MHSVPSTTHNLTSQPSCEEANQKEDEETFTRHDFLRILDGRAAVDSFDILVMLPDPAADWAASESTQPAPVAGRT